jgi:hypothetical protein
MAEGENTDESEKIRLAAIAAELEDAEEEARLAAEEAANARIEIITIAVGEIAGKGLVPVGSKHSIHPSAFSENWMILNNLTADEVMEIDPRHRYKVNLTAMTHGELMVLMANMGIKTQKRAMKRSDVERLISTRLMAMADEAEDAE